MDCCINLDENDDKMDIDYLELNDIDNQCANPVDDEMDIDYDYSIDLPKFGSNDKCIYSDDIQTDEDDDINDDNTALHFNLVHFFIFLINNDTVSLNPIMVLIIYIYSNIINKNNYHLISK